MKTEMRHSVLKLAAVISALALGGVTSALAQSQGGTVGGSVVAINTLATTFSSGISIGSATPNTANGRTDVEVVHGTIDNNSVMGWRLTVHSDNIGKLKRGSGGAGQEILYTSVKFHQTGGTLGTDLTNPSDTSKSIVTGVNGGDVAGTTFFSTGTAPSGPHGTASTATQAYAFQLLITWSSDLTLLAGTYSDTLTLTLADDS